MGGVVHLAASAYSRAALARLGPALAVSALMHLVLLLALPLGTQWSGILARPGDAPITVRLAPALVPVPDVPAFPEPGARQILPQPEPLAGTAERARSQPSASVAARAGNAVVAPPQAVDSSYYSAQDLDRFPRPVAPFQVNRTAGDRAGEVRLEILIDERGIVRDITIAKSRAPARLEEELRATLSATRFLPAEKGGRAVKSRIVLSVRFADAREQ